MQLCFDLDLHHVTTLEANLAQLSKEADEAQVTAQVLENMIPNMIRRKREGSGCWPDPHSLKTKHTTLKIESLDSPIRFVKTSEELIALVAKYLSFPPHVIRNLKLLDGSEILTVEHVSKLEVGHVLQVTLDLVNLGFTFEVSDDLREKMSPLCPQDMILETDEPAHYREGGYESITFANMVGCQGWALVKDGRYVAALHAASLDLLLQKKESIPIRWFVELAKQHPDHTIVVVGQSFSSLHFRFLELLVPKSAILWLDEGGEYLDGTAYNITVYSAR